MLPHTERKKRNLHWFGTNDIKEYAALARYRQYLPKHPGPGWNPLGF